MLPGVRQKEIQITVDFGALHWLFRCQHWAANTRVWLMAIDGFGLTCHLRLVELLAWHVKDVVNMLIISRY